MDWRVYTKPDDVPNVTFIQVDAPNHGPVADPPTKRRLFDAWHTSGKS
jgi:hypothetical protein